MFLDSTKYWLFYLCKMWNSSLFFSRTILALKSATCSPQAVPVALPSSVQRNNKPIHTSALNCTWYVLVSFLSESELRFDRALIWWAVNMTQGQLSRWSEFTLVPSPGSTFVYMIPPQNFMPARVTSPRREFSPVVVPGREFHSGTKSRNGIM